MSISHLGLSVILSCWLAHPALAQKKVPDGAKVFLLSGGQRQHHGYREQALYLSGTLENTGRFQVTIGEDAAILETPAMRKYDLLIVTADRRDAGIQVHARPARGDLRFRPVRATAMSRSTAPTTPPRTGSPRGRRCSAAFTPTSASPTARRARALTPSRSPIPPAPSHKD